MTDNKPLTSIFGGVPLIAAVHLQSWALKLAAYSYNIQFCRSNEHSNADGLSGLPLHHVSPLGYTSETTVFNWQQIDSLRVTATKLAMATRTDSRVYQYIIRDWPQTRIHH